MYYGNSQAQSTSCGGDVFDFFDDFSQNELDREIWEAYIGSGGSYELINSQLKLDGTVVKTKNYRFGDGIIEYQAKAEIPLDSEHPMWQTGFEARLIIRADEVDLEQVAYSSAYEGAEHCLAIGNIVKKNQAKPILAGVTYSYKVEAQGDNLTFKRYRELSTSAGWVK